ncbi:MAG TPA: hypothetical protein VL493_10145, partial [Candidatus Saccharimonadales bacterium]|nr:hypothetical protein [Candidatus Saccharimonadales bacterium]
MIISMITAFFAATPPQPAAAIEVSTKTVVKNTDFESAGFGGMRGGDGTGTITLAAFTGTVTKALLYWHGPTNSANSAA